MDCDHLESLWPSYGEQLPFLNPNRYCHVGTLRTLWPPSIFEISLFFSVGSNLKKTHCGPNKIFLWVKSILVCDCLSRGVDWFHILQINAQTWNCWIIWQLYFKLLEESSWLFPIVTCQFTFPPTAHRVDLNLLNFYSLKELKSIRSKYGCAHFLCWYTVGTGARRALRTFRTQSSGLSEGSAVQPWHGPLYSSRSFPLTALTGLPTAWLLINTDQRIKVRIKVLEEGCPWW